MVLPPCCNFLIHNIKDHDIVEYSITTQKIPEKLKRHFHDNRYIYIYIYIHSPKMIKSLDATEIY